MSEREFLLQVEVKKLSKKVEVLQAAVDAQGHGCVVKFYKCFYCKIVFYSLSMCNTHIYIFRVHDTFRELVVRRTS